MAQTNRPTLRETSGRSQIPNLPDALELEAATTDGEVRPARRVLLLLTAGSIVRKEVRGSRRPGTSWSFGGRRQPAAGASSSRLRHQATACPREWRRHTNPALQQYSYWSSTARPEHREFHRNPLFVFVFKPSTQLSQFWLLMCFGTFQCRKQHQNAWKLNAELLRNPCL
jgi:hypothetical protein